MFIVNQIASIDNAPTNLVASESYAMVEELPSGIQCHCNSHLIAFVLRTFCNLLSEKIILVLPWFVIFCTIGRHKLSSSPHCHFLPTFPIFILLFQIFSISSFYSVCTSPTLQHVFLLQLPVVYRVALRLTVVILSRFYISDVCQHPDGLGFAAMSVLDGIFTACRCYLFLTVISQSVHWKVRCPALIFVLYK